MKNRDVTMKTSKLYDILSWAFLTVQIVAEILLGAFIARLNMLPTMYNVLLIFAGVLLAAGTAALLFAGKKSKKGFLIRRCVGWGMAVLVVIGCVIGANVTADIFETLSSMTTQPEEEGVVRSVIVLKDDPAKTLADAAQYRFGIMSDYDDYYTEKTVEKIQQQLGKQITLVEFDYTSVMLDALLAKQVDAIILSRGILETAEEEFEEYADLSDKIRFLYDAVIPEESEELGNESTGPEGTTGPEESTGPEENTTGSDVTEPPVVTLPTYTGPITERPFIVYVSGSDSRSTAISNSGRSDVNILVVVNPVTKQVLLVSTPRDAYVPNPRYNGALDKLTHCGNAGINNTIKALEALYGVSVDYNARINFTGFETLINAIGGITVYSPVAFKAGESREYQIVKGDNHLDGKGALAFARERYNLINGDFGRGANQMRVIKAVVDKVTSGPAIIANYSAILDSIKGMFTMKGITMNDISELVKMQLTDMASWEVYSYGVQGSSTGAITASWPGQKLSVVVLYDSHVTKATNAIAKMMSGEKLSQKDVG